MLRRIASDYGDNLGPAATEPRPRRFIPSAEYAQKIGILDAVVLGGRSKFLALAISGFGLASRNRRMPSAANRK